MNSKSIKALLNYIDESHKSISIEKRTELRKNIEHRLNNLEGNLKKKEEKSPYDESLYGVRTHIYNELKKGNDVPNPLKYNGKVYKWYDEWNDVGEIKWISFEGEPE